MDAAFQAFLQILLEALAGIVAGVVASLVIAALTYVVKLIKSKLSAATLAQVEAIVAFVVLAAEQTHVTDELAKLGTEKKVWALAEAQRLLDERGLKGISAATLETILESKVRQLINGSQFGTFEYAELEKVPGTPGTTAPATS